MRFKSKILEAKYIRNTIRPLISDSLYLIIAFYASYMLAPFFKAPFHNEYAISNPLNSTGFNPENNFYQIIFIMIGTIAGYFILKLLHSKRKFMAIKLIVIAILALNFFLVNSLFTPGYSTGPNGLDNFHAGEILSPSHAYMEGRTPYEDIFYLRGAGIDAVIPSLSYAFAGESVGTFLMQIDLLMILAIVSFFILLALLIKDPFWFTAIAIAAFASKAVSLVEIRDVFIWLSVGLLLVAFRQALRPRTRYILLALIGFTASFTLYVVIDRGVIIFSAVALLAATLPFIAVDKIGALHFSPRSWQHNLRWPAALVGGMLFGFITPIPFIGIPAFIQFMTMTFIEIPKFGGLLVSQPFPVLFGDRYLIWGPVILAIVTTIGLLTLYRAHWRTQLNMLIPLTVILIVGILCIKGGANRIDLTKMASVIVPLFLASALVLWALLKEIREHKESVRLLAMPIVATLIIFASFAQLDLSRFVVDPSYTRGDLKQYLRLPRTSDEKWITLEARAVRDAILNSTDSDDHIFAFTSDPIYYYLADRPNPTRFYVSWFADPQPYTTELLNDLKSNPPKLVIYEEKTWMDAPDTISMKDRIPEVNEWITRNYSKPTTIGNTTLLYKN